MKKKFVGNEDPSENILEGSLFSTDNSREA
jgi:hypothetical protein